MTNKLENKVKTICKAYAKEYDSGMSGFISNLREGGCQSGLISELIYYNDTLKFFKKYKNEINVLLSERLDCTGLTLTELFGENWDNSDPLALEINNMNLLSWFAFEETAFNLFPEE